MLNISIKFDLIPQKKFKQLCLRKCYTADPVINAKGNIIKEEMGMELT